MIQPSLNIYIYIYIYIYIDRTMREGGMEDLNHGYFSY